MNKKSIKDIDITGKRVLMRVDFNVPLDKQQNVTDDNRIRASLPTIKFILENGAKLILMSHLGRPKGEVKPEYSLKPAATVLSKLLSKPVKMLDDCIGPAVKEAVSKMSDGDIVMLENLRFHKEETGNDQGFSKELASLGDVFVNDAFGTCHRAHASTEGVTHYLESVSGLLVEKEIEYFQKILTSPDKPFVFLLGGAKVADKIPVIENMMDKAGTIIIGGAMAYTFMKVNNVDIGSSRFEQEMVDTAKAILAKAREKGVEIVLPIDHVVTDNIETGSNIKITDGESIEKGFIGVDIGPKTINLFIEELKIAKTIVWNGPVGIFENDRFANGTKALAYTIAESDAVSVIGGGDTAAAVAKFDVADKMSHISTGGGASLEYLEGKVLPGVAALAEKKGDMMRKPIIAGNWKMHNKIKEAVELVNGLKRELSSIDTVDIVVCPMFTALSDVHELLIDSNIALGAQNLYWEQKGAFTGEVSADMLKDAGCDYVIIGHSERRQFFHETNETVNKRIKAALLSGLKPIVCVGEALEEREKGMTFDVVKNHVNGSLAGLSKADMKDMVLAYEPVWAIGTGRTATPDQAQEVHHYIRGLLKEMFGDEVASGTRIQYGGSVKPDNIKELMGKEDLDGALVGGASLKVDSFSAIVKGAV